jgi:hypothetical protein
MQSYQFFVQDDRYSVPNLMFVQAANDLRARSLAEQTLVRSPHYLGVDVYAEDRLVVALGGDAVGSPQTVH